MLKAVHEIIGTSAPGRYFHDFVAASMVECQPTHGNRGEFNEP